MAGENSKGIRSNKRRNVALSLENRAREGRVRGGLRGLYSLTVALFQPPPRS